MSNCTKCEVELVKDKNWYRTDYTRNSHICKKCKDLWHKTHPEIVRRSNLKRKNMALMIVGHDKIECANCGCKDTRIMEINHRNGNGRVEFLGKPRGSVFYKDIIDGKRSIDDLELRCRICNALHFVESKFPSILGKFEIHYRD